MKRVFAAVMAIALLCMCIPVWNVAAEDEMLEFGVSDAIELRTALLKTSASAKYIYLNNSLSDLNNSFTVNGECILDFNGYSLSGQKVNFYLKAGLLDLIDTNITVTSGSIFDLNGGDLIVENGYICSPQRIFFLASSYNSSVVINNGLFISQADDVIHTQSQSADAPNRLEINGGEFIGCSTSGAWVATASDTTEVVVNRGSFYNTNGRALNLFSLNNVPVGDGCVVTHDGQVIEDVTHLDTEVTNTRIVQVGESISEFATMDIVNGSQGSPNGGFVYLDSKEVVALKGYRYPISMSCDNAYDPLWQCASAEILEPTSKNTYVIPDEDATIYANATIKPTYTISLDTVSNGSVSIPDMANPIYPGKKVTIDVTPDSDCGVRTIGVVGDTSSESIKLTQSGDSYSFTMPEENVTVSVDIEPHYGWIWTSNDFTMGDIYLDRSRHFEGETATFTIEPKPGYKLKSVSAFATYGEGWQPVPVTGNTIVWPDHEVSFYVQFEDADWNAIHFNQTGTVEANVDIVDGNKLGNVIHIDCDYDYTKQYVESCEVYTMDGETKVPVAITNEEITNITTNPQSPLAHYATSFVMPDAEVYVDFSMKPYTITYVSSLSDLTSSLVRDGLYLMLTNNISGYVACTVTGHVFLDTGNYTISSDNIRIIPSENSRLFVKGNIVSNGNTYPIIENMGGNVIIVDGKMTGASGQKLLYYGGSHGGSLQIWNGTFIASGYNGVVLYSGMGNADITPAYIRIDDGYFIAQQAVFQGPELDYNHLTIHHGTFYTTLGQRPFSFYEGTKGINDDKKTFDPNACVVIAGVVTTKFGLGSQTLESGSIIQVGHDESEFVDVSMTVGEHGKAAFLTGADDGSWHNTYKTSMKVLSGVQIPIREFPDKHYKLGTWMAVSGDFTEDPVWYIPPTSNDQIIVSFTLDPEVLTDDKVELLNSSFDYNGEIKEPSVIVKDKDGIELTRDVAYTVDYENNKAVGTAKAIIKGCGEYTGTVEKDFVINPCGFYEYRNVADDMQLMKDGEDCFETTLVEFNECLIYFENGIWNPVFTGIVDDKYIVGGVWSEAFTGFYGNQYIKDGIFTKVTTLIKDIDGKWYYVKDGVKNAATTLVKYSGKWYYVEKGVTAPKANTLVKYNNKWYYVKNGIYNSANKDTTLVKYNGKWYYVKSGVYTKVTTLCKYNNKWYYVQNGVTVPTATTLCKYNNKWYYVKNGVTNTSTTLVKYNSKWYFVKNGLYNSANKDTTLVKYSDGKWYYVKNGVKNTSTCVMTYNKVKRYIKGGVWQSGFSGKVKIGTKTYTVKKGNIA